MKGEKLRIIKGADHSYNDYDNDDDGGNDIRTYRKKGENPKPT